MPATATRSETASALARSSASPIANAHRVRRSSHESPPAPVPATPATHFAASPPPVSAPPYSFLLPHSTPAPTARVHAGPVSRSPSAATPPAPRTVPAPCTPATAVADNAATRLVHLFRSRHTRLTAARPT